LALDRTLRVSRDVFEIKQLYSIALGHRFLNRLCRTTSSE